MTKVQEEVCAELFTVAKQKLQDLLNNDKIAAQMLLERQVDDLVKLFQIKGIELKLPAKV